MHKKKQQQRRDDHRLKRQIVAGEAVASGASWCYPGDTCYACNSSYSSSSSRVGVAAV